MNQEQAPENGQVHIFELVAEQQRTDLAKWAEGILPGTDLVHLQSRVVVGDLVMNRPGFNAFEVFRKVEAMNSDRIHARLTAVQLAEGDLDKAKDIDIWVHGGVQ